VIECGLGLEVGILGGGIGEVSRMDMVARLVTDIHGLFLRKKK
jgi:hypothetical protein